MTAYENSRKQLIRPDLRKLIEHLTNFKNDDLEYKQCEAFAFSHLLYHNFLSVNKPQVQRTIYGLINKFNVHGLNEKAKKLEILVEKFVNADKFKDHSEVDVEWSILQLLACLSDNPTSLSFGKDFQPISLKIHQLPTEARVSPSLQEEEEDDDTLNWGEYLKEGNERFNLPKDEDEGSIVWSGLEDDDDDDEEEGELENSTFEDHPLGLQILPAKNDSQLVEPSSVEKLKSDRQTSKKLLDDRSSESWLKQNIQYNWWNDPTLRIEPNSSHPYARLVAHWEELENKQTHGLLPIGGTSLVTEYKVICEALWMLQVPTTTFIFQVSDDGHVSTKPNLSIPSLTPDTFAALLNNSFCKYSEIVLRLTSFIDDVKNGESEDKKPPYTYQSYAAALQEQLFIFSQSVCRIEQKVMRQESTNTLKSVLEELRPEFEKLDFLYSLHTVSVCDWRSAQGWFACVKLLAHLYSSVCTSSKKESAAISLEIFIKSFRVYIQMIDSWFSEGKLLDYRSEFIIARFDEELKIVAFNAVLEEMKKPEIATIFNTITNASSDLECIRRLDETTALKTEVGKKSDLYIEFLMKIGAEVGKFKSERDEDPEESTILFGSKKESSSNSEDNPYTDNDILASEQKRGGLSEDIQSCSNSAAGKPSLNFPAKEVDSMWYDLVTRKILDSSWLIGAFKEYYPERKAITGEKLENIDSYRNTFLNQTGDTTVCSIPVHRIVEGILVSLITERGSIASKIMVEVLMTRYRLHQHLSILGSFFALESSHIVQTFFTSLFTKTLINNSVEGTESSLNILLDECVERFPGAESLGVHMSVHILDEPDSVAHNIIDCIEIGYKVEWPITLVITNESMKIYNSIFKFLVQIEWALHSLHQLRFSEIKETEENFTRVRLLYKLRMFLVHCVSTLHYYFLSFTPSHLRLKFEEVLNQSHCLNNIIKAHESYLEKLTVHCLMNKGSILLKVVKKILFMCGDLNSLWHKESLSELKFEEINELEEQYVRAHIILNLLLKNAAEQNSNPALQSLSMDIESCLPAQASDFGAESDAIP